MARMPGADYRPLSIHGGAMTGHDIACIHTMVGSLWGTDAYFRSGVANSHFGTGGDGHLVQWLDTATESWANLDGNPNVITCENADMGPEFAPWSGSDVPAFTPAQVEILARWLAWVCSPAAHADCPTSWTCHAQGIPLELIPDDRPGRRGVGYHRHGIDNWRVTGGVLWSSHTGKVCPGDRRIAQVPAVIARAISLSEEDDMPTADEIAEAVWAKVINDGSNAAARLVGTEKNAGMAVTRLDKLLAGQLDPAALAAALAKLLPSGSAPSADQLDASLKRVLGSLDNAPS